MANEIQTVSSAPIGVTAGFQSAEGFALLQRMANMFASSTLVPQQFQGKDNIGNCVIALNMAQRLGADPLMVMQNLYVVHGNPSWSSKFLIAMFNQCGRYESIHYRETGKKGTDTQGIVAWAKEKSTGEIIEGPEVTIRIAKDEGWYGRSGSKWKTMPDQMLRYRAAAWMIRTTAPELSMGLQTAEEVIDVTSDVTEKPLAEIRRHANTEELVPPVPAAQAATGAPRADVPEKTIAEPAPTVKTANAGATKANAEGPGF